MNDPHFETYPQDPKVDNLRDQPAGQFGWRFQDSNGRITFIGGEGFDSRSNARRAIRGAAGDVAELIATLLPMEVVPDVGQLGQALAHLPVVDLDAEGNLVEVE